MTRHKKNKDVKEHWLAQKEPAIAILIIIIALFSFVVFGSIGGLPLLNYDAKMGIALAAVILGFGFSAVRYFLRKRFVRQLVEKAIGTQDNNKYIEKAAFQEEWTLR